MYARDWRPDDLSNLQAVVAARWAVHGPRAGWHVGDMAWWVGQWPWPGPDGPTGRRRLWFDNGTHSPVGWGWATPPSEFDFAVHPDYDHAGVHDLILHWAAQNLSTIETSALDVDQASISALRRAGLSQAEPYLVQLAVPLAEPPAEELHVPGYTLRAVTGPADLTRRVDVHRAVWHPSSVTVGSYRRVMASRPYRPELDRVAVAADGSFAAYALGWLDAVNGSVELEPVGTHPEHRRRGLARAVCLAVLRAAGRLGASVGVVYCRPDSPAQATYRSVGFRQTSIRYRWRATKGSVDRHG